jgi:hypothetical protein
MTGEQAIGKPLGESADLITDVGLQPVGKRLVAGQFDARYEPAESNRSAETLTRVPAGTASR